MDKVDSNSSYDGQVRLKLKAKSMTTLLFWADGTREQTRETRYEPR